MVANASLKGARAQHGHFRSLDALRGLCALIVAMFHFRSSGVLGELAIVRHGWLFVDYFFVLSGFVIAHSYGDRLAQRQISLARFIGLRIGRIYPLHLAMLAALLALELVLYLLPEAIGVLVSREPFTNGRSLTELWQSLLLLQSFGLTDRLTWNGPSWSIAAEMWTYLLFALILAAKGGHRLGLIVVAVLGTGSWLVFVSGRLDLTFDLGIIRCIFGFGLGSGTYLLFRKHGGPAGTAWELGVLAAAALFVSLIGEGRWAIAAPVLFAGCVWILASGRGAISLMLQWRPFQLLGLVSYSIYMVHVFVQSRLVELLQLTGWLAVASSPDGGVRVVAPPVQGDLAMLLMLVVVVLASWLSWRLVESPGRLFSRRLLLGARS